MSLVRGIGTVLGGAAAGGLVGASLGFGLGVFLGLGYHRAGPADPADAPAMVTVGLAYIFALAGALVGVVWAAVRLWRAHRKLASKLVA